MLKLKKFFSKKEHPCETQDNLAKLALPFYSGIQFSQDDIKTILKDLETYIPDISKSVNIQDPEVVNSIISLLAVPMRESKMNCEETPEYSFYKQEREIRKEEKRRQQEEVKAREEKRRQDKEDFIKANVDTIKRVSTQIKNPNNRSVPLSALTTEDLETLRTSIDNYSRSSTSTIGNSDLFATENNQRGEKKKTTAKKTTAKKTTAKKTTAKKTTAKKTTAKKTTAKKTIKKKVTKKA